MKNPHPVWRGLFGGFLGLCLASGSTRAISPPSDAVVTFLHTNDLHGRVISGLDFEDATRGGLARAATLVKRIRSENPNVVFVDSGDLLHGSPVEFMTRGTSMVEAMNAAGVEISTPGNHEFDWGQDNTRRAMELAHFQWVSSNVLERATDTPLSPARPYVIRELGGVRVAFFGLTTLETVDLEWPPFIDRLRFDDPIQVAARLVPELRRQADVIVALSHLGVLEDIRLSEQVPGIDVILGGHSHTTLDTREENAGVQIAQTGYYGQFLGRLDLKLHRDSELDPWKIVDVNGKNGHWWQPAQSALIPLGPEVEPDSAVVAAYTPAWNDWKSLGFASLGIAGALISDHPDHGVPGDSPMSRFLADRLRESTRADLALTDGGWSGHLEAGPVTPFLLWNTMGGYTRQNILSLQVTGVQILAFLEQYAEFSGSTSIGVSGLISEIDSSLPVGHRVIRAELKGQAVDPSASYLVSGVAYVLQRFPSLISSAPSTVDLPVLWSRDLILEATRKLESLLPDPTPRIVVH